MQCLILAGGEGVRLRPRTLINPKSMIRVQGKPFLEHLLLLLKRRGITDIVISIGYLAGQIKSYFGNGSYWGLDIKYSFERVSLGTGGALKLAGQLLDSEFFLINGDTYLDIDYRHMAKVFRMSNRDLMIALCLAGKANCHIDNSGNMVEYQKGGLKPDRYVDAGVWIARKDELFKHFPREANFSLESDVLPNVVSPLLRRVKTFISKNRFYDIGTFKGLEEFRNYIYSGFLQNGH